MQKDGIILSSCEQLANTDPAHNVSFRHCLERLCDYLNFRIWCHGSYLFLKKGDNEWTPNNWAPGRSVEITWPVKLILLQETNEQTRISWDKHRQAKRSLYEGYIIQQNIIQHYHYQICLSKSVVKVWCYGLAYGPLLAAVLLLPMTDPAQPIVPSFLQGDTRNNVTGKL